MMSYSRQAILGVTAILGIALLAAPLRSQTQDLPPGVIDGSKEPQRIPDSTAFRLVFLSLRIPTSPSPADLKRQSAHFKRIGLSGVDFAASLPIIADFGTAYDEWQTRFDPTSKSIDVAASTSEREALVEATIVSVMHRLSPAGAAKFVQFVQAAKSRMVVHE
jgi:hypothetical protein